MQINWRWFMWMYSLFFFGRRCAHWQWSRFCWLLKVMSSELEQIMQQQVRQDDTWLQQYLSDLLWCRLPLCCSSRCFGCSTCRMFSYPSLNSLAEKSRVSLVQDLWISPPQSLRIVYESCIFTFVASSPSFPRTFFNVLSLWGFLLEC